MKNIDTRVNEKLGFFTGGFRKKMSDKLLCSMNGKLYYHILITLFKNDTTHTTTEIENNIR